MNYKIGRAIYFLLNVEEIYYININTNEETLYCIINC